MAYQTTDLEKKRLWKTRCSKPSVGKPVSNTRLWENNTFWETDVEENHSGKINIVDTRNGTNDLGKNDFGKKRLWKPMKSWQMKSMKPISMLPMKSITMASMVSLKNAQLPCRPSLRFLQCRTMHDGDTMKFSSE